MFVRIESDDMSVNRKWAAIVLDAPHAHWPALRKWISPTLFLESKMIEDCPRACEKIFWIQNCQINNALPTATRNRGAPHVLNLELWLDTPESGSKKVCNLNDLWVVSTKLRRHRKVRKNAHGHRL